MKTLENTLKEADKNRDRIHAEWLKSVQAIADKYQIEIATGHLSDAWQVNTGLGKDDFRALYDDKENPALLELEELDAKTQDYGVGPSNMERFKPRNPYDVQAESFLARNGLKFRATLSDSKTPAWSDDGKHGHHYRVTLSKNGGGVKIGSLVAVEFTNGPKPGVYLKPDRVRSFAGPFANHSEAEDARVILERKPSRLVFDFWSSSTDAEAGIETVSAYSVLACISSETYCPETFGEWCDEYGVTSDSIKNLQTFRRCSAFAKRLRAFFTEQELQELSEIN